MDYNKGDTDPPFFMSLSDKTQEYLDEAAASLRNALWYAAKNERPQTITQLAELLNACDKISTVDDILSHLDNMKSKGDLKWRDFE